MPVCSRTLGVLLCQLVLVGILVLVCVPVWVCHLAVAMPVYVAVGVYAPVRMRSPAIVMRSCIPARLSWCRGAGGRPGSRSPPLPRQSCRRALCGSPAWRGVGYGMGTVAPGQDGDSGLAPHRCFLIHWLKTGSGEGLEATPWPWRGCGAGAPRCPPTPWAGPPRALRLEK